MQTSESRRCRYSNGEQSHRLPWLAGSHSCPGLPGPSRAGSCYSPRLPVPLPSNSQEAALADPAPAESGPNHTFSGPPNLWHPKELLGPS